MLYNSNIITINRTCPEVHPWLYGYDAIKEVKKAVTQNPDVFAKQHASRSSTCSLL
jgi:salicylate hydroxylase